MNYYEIQDIGKLTPPRQLYAPAFLNYYNVVLYSKKEFPQKSVTKSANAAIIVRLRS